MLSSSLTKISAVDFKFFRVCAKKFFVLELRVSRDQLLVVLGVREIVRRTCARFSFRYAWKISKDFFERAVLRRLLLDLRNNRDSIAALNKGQYMRIATARNEMKKPVRTVSIRGGNFRKGDGKFRLYSYKNAGYAERVKTAALHTLLQGSLARRGRASWGALYP